MASLIEKSACDGLLPKVAGGTVLSEFPATRVTSVAPFAGKARALGAALKEMGLGWPKPGSSVATEAVAILWSGRDQAFLIGADPAPLSGLAALSDQGDGWARMLLKGPEAEAALARLVPLDLRLSEFGIGQVARSGLNHMMILIARTSGTGFDILVFRSMAASAVHEIGMAMDAVAARGRLTS